MLVLALVQGAPQPSTPRARLPFLSVRLNGYQSCQVCLKDCAPTSVSSKWVTECNKLRQNIRNIKKRDRLMSGKRRGGYRDALLYYCFLNYCRSFKVNEYCGLHPAGEKKRSLAALNSEIALLKKQRLALQARFKREAAPRFNFPNYLQKRAEVQELQRKARKNLLVALNSKAKNARLKEQLKTLEYRKQKFLVKKLTNEIDFYETYTTYWSKLEFNYKKALRTSAKSVRIIRDQLLKDTQLKFKEVNKVRNFEAAIGNEEKQLSVLDNFENILIVRLRNVEDLIVRADGDFSLFRIIGFRIAALLDNMTNKIRAGTLDVGCTTEALAVAVALHTTG